jgi:hypothetical protein
MDASVAFQYLVSDVCNIITVQVQHLHQLMQVGAFYKPIATAIRDCFIIEGKRKTMGT